MLWPDVIDLVGTSENFSHFDVAQLLNEIYRQIESKIAIQKSNELTRFYPRKGLNVVLKSDNLIRLVIRFLYYRSS